jgi:hypothetical protein
MLTVGWPACTGADVGSGTLADPSYLFTIGGSDFAHVAPGVTFSILSTPNATVGATRLTEGKSGVPLTLKTIGQADATPITAGSLHFDTFDEVRRAATGSYEVTSPGAASGTFSADFCPGMTCVP